jgi:DNA-binding LytR/AlgR family response regulator
MTCIIIEDQPPAQRILKKYIEDTGHLQLMGTFSDAIQAMEFLRSQPVDLIFLDIHLPKISGIDFMKTLPHPSPVILTTAFPDYALESYEYHVVDYLLKPFSFQRFLKAISRVPTEKPQIPEGAGLAEERQDSPQTFFIKSGYEYIKIAAADIIFIKSDADYTEVYLPGKKYLSSDALRQWLEKLDKDRFIQVHKSYVVNVSRISKVSGNRIFLAEDQVVPIGRAYKEDFVKRFLK